MGCAVVGCLTIISSRIALAVTWIFSSFFSTTAPWPWSWLCPLMGLFFCPMTALWVAGVANWMGGRWGFWQVAVLIACLLIDGATDDRAAKTAHVKKNGGSS